MTTLQPEKVYWKLRRKLVGGELPPGIRLEYKTISTEMGISATPVREAMCRLAGEGLVDLVPRAGAVVRGLGEQEAVQLFGIREAIETYAASRAAQGMSDLGLRQLESLLQRMRRIISRAGDKLSERNLAAMIEVDLDFHSTFVEAAGNAMLTKLSRDNHVRSRAFIAAQMHALIYRSLKRRDAAGASQLVLQHLRRCLRLALAGRVIYRLPWEDGSLRSSA
jgi:DNA-binding GntR family transcriptional regulator